MKTDIGLYLKTLLGNLNTLEKYNRGSRAMKDCIGQRRTLLERLIRNSSGKHCLQVGMRGSKFAPHWKVVDLYDTNPLVDYHYDLCDLEFEDSSFDTIVCPAILEHVPNPLTAIGEMHRVLKQNGEIWIEIPFNQPYHPSPQDYWRVTPEGIKIWMKDFKEISSGCFLQRKSTIYSSVFFYGRKE